MTSVFFDCEKTLTISEDKQDNDCKEKYIHIIHLQTVTLMYAYIALIFRTILIIMVVIWLAHYYSKSNILRHDSYES